MRLTGEERSKYGAEWERGGLLTRQSLSAVSEDWALSLLRVGTNLRNPPTEEPVSYTDVGLSSDSLGSLCSVCFPNACLMYYLSPTGETA